jgi:hyperosmotically inducible periplasmic protein
MARQPGAGRPRAAPAPRRARPLASPTPRRISLKRALIAVALCSLGPALAASGCATQRTTGEEFDDAAIANRVSAKLGIDPELRRYDIHVDARENIVTLRGLVSSPQERQEAERIARDSRGVRGVNNRLEVGEVPGAGGEGGGAGGGGAGGGGADEATTEERDRPDAWVTTKVKSKLATDMDVRARDVNVDTEDSVVTLSGVVRSRQEAEEAERLARETEGVQEVRNELQVAAEED